jgi:hypothetical protein
MIKAIDVIMNNGRKIACIPLLVSEWANYPSLAGADDGALHI